MAWSPPQLTTQRLRLVARDDNPRSFISDGRSAAEQDLPGLPSNWRIILKAPEQPIGSIGFIDWDREARLGEIGFMLANDESGRGYMTEACRAVVAFGFEKMGLEAVKAKSLPGNRASIRILEKLGMRKEKQIQGRLWSKGPIVDLDLFILRKPR